MDYYDSSIDLDNDIAIVILENPIYFDMPGESVITLLDQDETEISGTDGTVSGWGHTRWGEGETSKKLFAINISTICRKN